MSRKNSNNKKKPSRLPKRPSDITLQQLEEQCKRLPNNPTVWKGLAAWHLKCFDFNQAKPAAEKAFSLCRTDPSIAAMYSAVLYNSGEIHKAIETLEESFNSNPSNLQVCQDLAIMHYRSNFYELCQAVSGMGLKYHPENPKLIQFKASALKALHKLEEAYSLFKHLTAIDSANFRHWIDIGNIERDLGELDKSLESYKVAMDLSGQEGSAYSNYLTTVHYHPAMSRSDILEVCRKWQKKYSPGQIDTSHDYLDKMITKKLRIGLLSDGFKRSPVGQMITSVIEAYDKNNTEFIAFSTNDANDDLTDRLRRCCTQWHFVAQLLEDNLFKLIQDEKIDILIDLAGHNNGSRISTIAKKPAPIIIKWVGGLINTTAVDAIDYLISDWIETPEGDDHYYTEKLIRMPYDYICYDPPHYAPAVNSLPATKNGFITFGCFNNPTKINKELLQNWATIMHQLPNSKLFLKSFQFTSSALCERIAQTLLEFGISAGRLRLEGPSPHAELLAAYNDVDIALDTWPYSGGLTTCEAMLMGVPVVTLPGPTFAGRHSATHLINAGMPELVVDSWDMYQYRALELASDLNSLSTIRERLRLVLLQSPVCDAKHFATHLNNAIRAIWIRYCEGLKPTALHFSKSGEVCFTDLTTLDNQSKEIVKKVQSNDSNEGSKPIENYPEDGKKNTQINKIIALDHGGLLLTKSTTQKMLDSDALELIIFDPASNHLKNPLRNHPNIHYYPNIALGDGNPATLYACQSAELTGTLKPEPHEYMPKQLQDDLQVLAELPIGTVALDSVEAINSIEYMVISDLHDAILQLNNSKKCLEHTLIIDAKVCFQPTHSGQLDFPTILNWANENNFRFYCFVDEKKTHSIINTKNITSSSKEELNSVSALFIPNRKKLENLKKHQTEKLSSIMSEIYNLKAISEIANNQYKKEQDTTLKKNKDNKIKPHTKTQIIYDKNNTKTKENKYTLSVYLPVFNESKYIKKTIQSLKNQNVDDVVFFISDNCSTDDTFEIISDETYFDERFILHRQEKNIGASDNFKFIHENTHSDFCMFMGGHDLISDNYLRTCLDLIIRDDQISMACGHPYAISDNSQPILMTDAIYSFTDELPERRYLQSALLLANCTVVQSIYRRKHLNDFEIRKTISPDHVFISRLLWLGKLVQTSDARYFRRFFDKRNESQEERITGKKQDLCRESFYKYYCDDLESLYKNHKYKPKHSLEELKNALLTILRARFDS